MEYLRSGPPQTLNKHNHHMLTHAPTCNKSLHQTPDAARARSDSGAETHHQPAYQIRNGT